MLFVSLFFVFMLVNVSLWVSTTLKFQDTLTRIIAATMAAIGVFLIVTAVINVEAIVTAMS